MHRLLRPTQAANTFADNTSKGFTVSCGRAESVVMSGQATVNSPDAARAVAEWVADAAGQKPGSAPSGRRRSTRYVWPAPIEMLVNPGTACQRYVAATSLDISEEGMGLLIRHDPSAGDLVLLRLVDDRDRGPWVPARVMYSKRSISRYRVGVKFQLDPTS